jgi:hypothetical protein
MDHVQKTHPLPCNEWPSLLRIRCRRNTFTKLLLIQNILATPVLLCVCVYCSCHLAMGLCVTIFITDKPIFSSERMLHKDYDCKSSVEKKISRRESHRTWHQDELIGGKPSVVKWPRLLSSVSWEWVLYGSLWREDLSRRQKNSPRWSCYQATSNNRLRTLNCVL